MGRMQHCPGPMCLQGLAYLQRVRAEMQQARRYEFEEPPRAGTHIETAGFDLDRDLHFLLKGG